jgi:CheY-like chemotaxis protein
MSKPTILVAEDENALITLLRYNLEREGYRVLEARDGEEALLVAAEEKPDLVILDWMMPQLSGIEVCRRLRATPLGAKVPILLCTVRSAVATGSSTSSFRRSGCDGCDGAASGTSEADCVAMSPRRMPCASRMSCERQGMEHA